MNVKMFKGCPVFVAACEAATVILGKEVLPTHRQYKKWLKKQGSAWNHGRSA
jgi:hypothetical protein